MTEVEKFLAQAKLYHCEPLRASITLEQCEANRSRSMEYGNLKKLPKVYACEGCAGLGAAIKLEERTMAEAKCKCGEKVFVEGQCRKCYDKAKWQNKKASLKKVMDPTPMEAQDLPLPKVNPLLQAGSSRSIVLDLLHRHDLYNWIVQHEVSPDHIIELLECCMAGQVRRAA